MFMINLRVCNILNKKKNISLKHKVFTSHRYVTYSKWRHSRVTMHVPINSSSKCSLLLPKCRHSVCIMSRWRRFPVQRAAIKGAELGHRVRDLSSCYESEYLFQLSQVALQHHIYEEVTEVWFVCGLRDSS